MKLLRLMGVPIFEAASEAEAECVNMLKLKIADIVGSDDMDCLTFGCKTLIKGIWQAKEPVIEINLESVLKEIGFTMDQFMDFCILCGCDYLPTIQGLGPGNAMKLIKDFGAIENVLEHINQENKKREENGEKPWFLIPMDFDYASTRELFRFPNVTSSYPVFELSHCNFDEFRDFMINQKSFD